MIKLILLNKKDIEENKNFELIKFVDNKTFIESKLLGRFINEGYIISKPLKKLRYCEKLVGLKMNRIEKIETGFYRKSKRRYV